MLGPKAMTITIDLQQADESSLMFTSAWSVTSCLYPGCMHEK
jgi:hypothetical protein